ncbi:protein-(glutamine-N5) methyltransferase, release factor-specific [Candidatus Daviesbacteria bacterium RIFOXYD1_FULL_41_10]|uniref:Protein-(Glutamine-N5) methyltransferase, release factor-specific n=1 Tax=Candidatus Daviesbacteria bacterium RIFOXYD1_FULL_41_10 TaxID=1797801 RepID=A0A1F5MZE2_9BACT|nr:MAG: protein-(glutamine-N5) methyltransferase, release factor-specific [Candidatus Daviesbacteria bacterium RIFOXYD1_FULL_41_10]
MPYKRLQADKPKQYIQGWVEFYKQSLKNSTKDIPKAYIQGYVEFYKLKFKVTPDVLIPRPETELLVDEVLKFVHGSCFMVHRKTTNHQPRIDNRLTVLDLGTGAGNIAVSIAVTAAKIISHIGCVILIATDISEKALRVAKQNAMLHGVENKITFLKSNLLKGLRGVAQVDIIVTNLPYIPSARIPYLDCSVKDFEPHVALDGGEDGFELYRKLFQQIVDLNWHPKLIIGEIDYTHGELAIIEAMKYFPDAQIEVKKDLAHMQRILTIIG